MTQVRTHGYPNCGWNYIEDEYSDYPNSENEDDETDEQYYDYPDEPSKTVRNNFQLPIIEFEVNNDDSFDISEDDNNNLNLEFFQQKCQVCCENVTVPHNITWSNLDEIWTVENNWGFMFVCECHIICVKCMKNAFKSNLWALLHQGQGHIPCLGDIHCKIQEQISTVYFYNFKSLFNTIEWENYERIYYQWQTSQQICMHHPLHIPLTSQINDEKIIQQVKYLLNLNPHDSLAVTCPICQVKVEKASHCNALRHCDWEICWICSTMARRLPGDHWQICPRFDFAPILSEFKCKMGECFQTDTNECQNPHHWPGKKMYWYIQRAFRVMAWIKTLKGNLDLNFRELEILKTCQDLYQKCIN